MQKHVNLVDLVKSFPTNILLQKLASIQKRTSPIKFAHLTEKSEKDSVSNLSTKVGSAAAEEHTTSERLRGADQDASHRQANEGRCGRTRSAILRRAEGAVRKVQVRLLPAGNREKPPFANCK